MQIRERSGGNFQLAEPLLDFWSQARFSFLIAFWALSSAFSERVIRPELVNAARLHGVYPKDRRSAGGRAEATSTVWAEPFIELG